MPWESSSTWVTAVGETAARLLKKRLFNAECNGKDFVVEGGGIEVNGRGTLLTTEECYQHPKVQVRNPGLTRADYDETFRRYLGAKNVLWLVNGPVGDGAVATTCTTGPPKGSGPKSISPARAVTRFGS